MFTLFDQGRVTKLYGMKIGETRGMLTTLSGLVKDGNLTVPQAAESMNISVGEFRQRAEALL
ncbi:MAG: hypothetical protein Q4E17_07055 [Synergistes sp.]|nr:hypothetical protein [Synergistes sp.]